LKACLHCIQRTTLAQVLELVAAKQLFLVPDALIPFATLTTGDEGGDDEGEASADLAAIRASLQAPFSQVQAYRDYVNEAATFDTHHGVKGREFERVLVVINDAESRGFLYKYSALFNTKATTPRRKQQEERESSEDRVRRLFYVTCSRSKGSLAVVVYTDKPEAVSAHAVSKGWFATTEIEAVD
jgi:DNA helicase II / ATP-dependent DNA helicase PcrA